MSSEYVTRASVQKQCEDWYVVRIMADLVCESNFVAIYTVAT